MIKTSFESVSLLRFAFVIVNLHERLSEGYNFVCNRINVIKKTGQKCVIVVTERPFRLRNKGQQIILEGPESNLRPSFGYLG